MIFDNGQQFDTDKLHNYCADYGIQTRFRVVARPQTNEQAESTIKQILNGLKKRLDAAKGFWAYELPTLFWSMQITEKSTTGGTPFMLVYGS